MNQFFYKRRETIKQENLPDTFKEFTDSFSPEKVIRSIEMADGRRLVLLNDIHERSVDTPDINPKTNKMMGMKRQRDTYQSELYLSKEDSERFIKLTSLD